ncbi:Nma111 protein [Martiniozyma asiatica (nom. inval.)]|nr:Nma111 protein [Martiniozyma asiatica]
MTKREFGDEVENGDFKRQHIEISESPEDLAAFPHSDSDWQSVTNEVVKSVVSIHFMQPVNFDTESCLCSEATGFVVDADLGIIMTNRHVVGPSPFVGHAVFDNHEEVEVIPIYRDPVHDFGFLKFDPKEVKYMKVQALPLCPEKAKVGEEIRVIGNDSGEKLSILAGFISRLDRNAPNYGDQTYNDFNTEYIQAAASASGGSSGSPVVNFLGETVALQAGGNTETSTDFFLPVWRPKRALECVQETHYKNLTAKEIPNWGITRGTIQVQWMLEPFDKCRRLGLTSDVESKVRQLSNANREVNGMLVCTIALPDGPANGLLREGDCLVSVNDKLITSFVEVDEILDSNVGNKVEFVVQRSGKEIKHLISVGNLHDITPNRYVEVCGATFNDLSYQLARIYGIPVKGVYVAEAAGSFQLGNPDLTNCWIIDSVDDKPTPNLDTFIEVMKCIPDKAYIPIQYHHLTDIHVPLFRNIYIDRHWNKIIRMAERNDTTGVWDFTTIQKDPLPYVEITESKEVKFTELPADHDYIKNLSHSFVQVEATYELPLDSFTGHVRRVHGLVLDAEKGIVFVSRHCVAHDLCDINIIIAESVIIPAKPLFLHPTKGYALVKYDPASISKNTPLVSPKIKANHLQRGDKVVFVGFTKAGRLVIDDTKVQDVGLMNVPTNANAPRYKASNVEAVVMDSTQGQKCMSGLMCDYDGNIRAVWLACEGEEDRVYTMGIDIADLWELKGLLDSSLKEVSVLETEFTTLSISSARIQGVPTEWIKKLESTSRDKYQFMAVATISTGLDNKAITGLVPGDIILEANGETIGRWRDFEQVLHGSTLQKQNTVNVKVIRRKKLEELVINLSTYSLPACANDETFHSSHLLSFIGCTFQTPPQGVRQVINNLPSLIYTTTMSAGSPGRFYAVGITNFVTHVNDIPVNTIPEFVNELVKIKKETKEEGASKFVKLRVVTFDQIPMAIVVKVNWHYWGLGLWEWKNGNWGNVELDNYLLNN